MAIPFTGGMAVGITTGLGGEITLTAPYTDDKTLIRTFTIYEH